MSLRVLGDNFDNKKLINSKSNLKIFNDGCSDFRICMYFSWAGGG